VAACKPYDWLRSGFRRCAGDIVSRMRTRSGRALLPDEGASLLAEWGIDACRLRAAPGGSSGGTFVIETVDGLRVLRRSDSDERDWVTFQLQVVAHLQAAGFPYDVPRIVPTRASAPWIFDGQDYWYLYDYIGGLPALPPDSRARAAALGTLVGQFAAAMRDFDVASIAPLYQLDLYRDDAVARGFADALRQLADGCVRSEAADRIRRHADAILRLHADTPSAVRAAITAQQPSAVYYDWNNKNIVTRYGVTVGLIDYDSLAVAPRLVDFQNALTYVLISQRQLLPERASAFIGAYNAVLPLTDSEAMLVHPVMVDRALWLLTHLLHRLAVERSSALEQRMSRLVEVMMWLGRSGDWLADRCAGAPGAARRVAA
jgi:Ser/Thr protein kinase RdoA (MazF antagonist)